MILPISTTSDNNKRPEYIAFEFKKHSHCNFVI